MNPVIQKTNDYEKATQVAEACKSYFKTGFQQLLKDLKTQLLYGAFVDEKIVGFITYKENNKDVVEISWLAILPKYRNRGIGTELVSKTLAELKNKYQICEVKTLAETQPDPGYAKTRNFYKKLGFISLEIIYPYPGWDKNSPCQIFVKFLR